MAAPTGCMTSCPQCCRSSRRMRCAFWPRGLVLHAAGGRARLGVSWEGHWDWGAHAAAPAAPAAQVRERYLPTTIQGDLDSIRPDVLAFYRQRGVSVDDLSGESRAGWDGSAALHVLRAGQAPAFCCAAACGRCSHALARLCTSWAALTRRDGLGFIPLAADQDSTDLQKCIAYVVAHAAQQRLSLERLTVVALGAWRAGAAAPGCCAWPPLVLAAKRHCLLCCPAAVCRPPRPTPPAPPAPALPLRRAGRAAGSHPFQPVYPALPPRS